MYLIIVGCGRMGSNLAYELSDLGHDVCVIDRDKQRLSSLGSGFNGQRINGIEFDSDILSSAGIQQADALLAVTPNDNINITVSMVANKIYNVPHVIARVNDPKRKHLYERLNIEVINPVELGAELFLDKLNHDDSSIVAELTNNFEVIQLQVNKETAPISVEKLEQKYSCDINLITNSKGSMLPEPKYSIKLGDKLTCTVNKSDKEQLTKQFVKEA